MSHYQTLGIREGANPAEILWAYKSLQEAHKDSNDFELQIELNMAYQVLIHPVRRQEYDTDNLQPAVIAEQKQEVQPPYQIFNTYPQQNQQVTQNNPFVKPILVCIGCYLFGMLALSIILAIG